MSSNARKSGRHSMRTRNSKTSSPSTAIVSSDADTEDIGENVALSPATDASNDQNQLSDTELDNARSESASTAQVAPEQLVAGGAQPSTPRTPSSPPDHSHGTNTPNPPTPGNTSANSIISSSPQYVTITVDGDGDVRSEGVNGSSYVTYVESSTDHSKIYTAAANGPTVSYPVFSVGDSAGIYNSTNASTQYYSASTTGNTTTYTQDESLDDHNDAVDVIRTNYNHLTANRMSNQSNATSSPENHNSSFHINTHTHNHSPHSESGVFLTPSTGGSNNTVTVDVDGAPNIAHATRVSPATRRLPVRKKRVKRELFYADDDSDSDEQTQQVQNEDGSVSVITDEDLNRLAKMNMYPVANGALPIAGNSAFKSCPVTVQWLLENYETAEGVSLPRYTMYYHYLRHCADHKLDPVNAASFGKLIRSVFLGLRTRRLGTRGNSKYHYYGIRLKPNSTLNQLYDDGTPINGPNGYYTVNGRGTGVVLTSTIPGNGHIDNHRHPPSTNNNNNNHIGKRMKMSKGEGYDPTHLNGFQIHDPSASQFLGDPEQVLKDFPELDENLELPEGISSSDIVIFRNLYREHCESLLDALINFQMTNVESYWRTFWRAGESPSVSSDAPMEAQNYEKLLPKHKLILLCTFKKVQDFIRDADFQFYQNIVGFLLPDVLRPIPSTMTQAIRNFAKALEGWLTSAMSGFPQEIVKLKVSIVNSLAQTLRRYTSLNHLAQAARAVLQNQNQIAQMLTDLNRVDFNNVEEQASWVCECDSQLVPSLEQDFKATLAQQQTLEEWATWLEGVVDKILRPHMSSPKFVHMSRQFLLKWSFYSSLIIRDLTLRSAASFGSFHLLRLLYDEYMFYLVEHRVAQVTGVVPIAVIGKFDTVVQTTKADSSQLNDPSTAELMEAFAQPVDGSEEDTLDSSQTSQTTVVMAI